MEINKMMEYKRFAKDGCKEHGIKVATKNMDLYETGCSSNGRLHFVGNKEMNINYVMFKDCKTGKVYQVYYGAKYYNPDIDTLFSVYEYEA